MINIAITMSKVLHKLLKFSGFIVFVYFLFYNAVFSWCSLTVKAEKNNNKLTITVIVLWFKYNVFSTKFFNNTFYLYIKKERINASTIYISSNAGVSTLLSKIRLIDGSWESYSGNNRSNNNSDFSFFRTCNKKRFL